MRTVHEKAYGKLNLTLDIVGRRPDGYHDMRMIMQSVELHDDIAITLDTQEKPTCRCDGLLLPQGKENLALVAAERYFEIVGQRPDGYAIEITKRIPIQGGMAGGSSDAAAVLRGLQAAFGHPLSESALYELAAGIGSDVPYCVLGGTALAEGRGEILTQLRPIPNCSILLAQPTFAVSTPELFHAFDECKDALHPHTENAMAAVEVGDLQALCACMENSFQPILQERFPVIGDLCRGMRECGALGACLTGTGSVVFGIFTDDAAAEYAGSQLDGLCRKTFLTHPV